MPFSKSELAKAFNMSKSAVHNRLSDCGLDTGKTEYSDEEIETRFKVACDLADKNGYSRKEIREYFDVDNPGSTTGKTPKPNPNPDDSFSVNPHTLFTQAINDAVSGFFQQETEKAIRAFLPYTPHVVRRKWQEFIDSGEFAQAFVDYQNSVASHSYEVVYEHHQAPFWGLGAGEVTEETEKEVLGTISINDDEDHTQNDDENQSNQ